jgi:DNA-binding phage protein
MKWIVSYFEQENTVQPAEVFEDELYRANPKFLGKLLYIHDQLKEYGHQLGGGYVEKCHDYQGLWEIMNRHEQRKQKFLQDPEVAEGYLEMAAEFQLMQAIELIRSKQHISKEELATQMGKKREAISRLLTAHDANPTLATVVELLSALKLTADITLRRSKEGESSINVNTDSDLITTKCSNIP